MFFRCSIGEARHRRDCLFGQARDPGVEGLGSQWPPVQSAPRSSPAVDQRRGGHHCQVSRPVTPGKWIQYDSFFVKNQCWHSKGMFFWICCCSRFEKLNAAHVEKFQSCLQTVLDTSVTQQPDAAETETAVVNPGTDHATGEAPSLTILESIDKVKESEEITLKCNSEVSGVEFLKCKSGRLFLLSDKRRIIPKHTLLGGYGTGRYLGSCFFSQFLFWVLWLYLNFHFEHWIQHFRFQVRALWSGPWESREACRTCVGGWWQNRCADRHVVCESGINSRRCHVDLQVSAFDREDQTSDDVRHIVHDLLPQSSSGLRWLWHQAKGEALLPDLSWPQQGSDLQVHFLGQLFESEGFESGSHRFPFQIWPRTRGHKGSKTIRGFQDRNDAWGWQTCWNLEMIGDKLLLLISFDVLFVVFGFCRWSNCISKLISNKQ